MAVEEKQLIEKVLGVIPEAEVYPEGKDCDFTLNVISPSFEGSRPVARQQRVLSALTELISSGDLHSVSVKAFTPDEWKTKLSNAKAVQIEL